jgi:hypothetical protein
MKTIVVICIIIYSSGCYAFELTDPDFVIALEANPAPTMPIYAGHNVRFTLRIFNNGDVSLRNILARVFLPDKVEFMGRISADTIRYNKALSMLTMKFKKIENGNFRKKSFYVKVPDSTSRRKICNIASGTAYRKIGDSLIEVTNWSKPICHMLAP